MEAFLFLSSLRRSQALMRLLGHRQTYLFEYFTVQDTMVIPPFSVIFSPCPAARRRTYRG